MGKVHGMHPYVTQLLNVPDKLIHRPEKDRSSIEDFIVHMSPSTAEAAIVYASPGNGKPVTIPKLVFGIEVYVGFEVFLPVLKGRDIGIILTAVLVSHAHYRVLLNAPAAPVREVRYI
jgi:hypothetical protein